MAAIQLACTSLWAGDCDTAVAGGLNVMTNSDIFAGLSRGQFLSKTGNCQTYDNDADGYCRGDGIGTIILKRLEDAEADNDRILGVILETATNHSANAISITHPHAATQEDLFQKVMDDAGVDPHDVSYVVSKLPSCAIPSRCVLILYERKCTVPALKQAMGRR